MIIFDFNHDDEGKYALGSFSLMACFEPGFLLIFCGLAALWVTFERII